MNQRELRVLVASLIVVAFAPAGAGAHFFWIRVEPRDNATGRVSTVRLFFNEPPYAEDPSFLRLVEGVELFVNAQRLPLHKGENSFDATWLGRLPGMIDASRDLGVTARGGASHRFYYTARAQSAPVEIDSVEPLDSLRVRLVERNGKRLVQVLFDGKPVPHARLKMYPDGGDPRELSANEEGLADVPGVVEGNTSLWANWNDGMPGERDGKPFDETRFYSTLTFKAVPATENQDPPTRFAVAPEPAVNSFGGAVLGDWLYVYGGHVGRTHHYDVDTTSKRFRRLDLRDRTTWEELPMGKDVQGVALVSDGRDLYRVGGMSARNQPDQEHELFSVADFERFDPSTREWRALAPLPEPRSTHDAVVVGRKIYVVGGWTMKGATDESEFCRTALEYDLDNPESGWRSIEQPFRRRALSVGEAGGKLYVLGGLVGGGSNVERQVDIYDPASGKWSIGPALPGSTRVEGFGTSAITMDGRLYVSGASGTVWRLNVAGNGWEPVGAWYQPRITHRLLVGPGRSLLAVGGNVRGKQTPIIEFLPLTPSDKSAASQGDRRDD